MTRSRRSFVFCFGRWVGGRLASLSCLVASFSCLVCLLSPSPHHPPPPSSSSSSALSLIYSSAHLLTPSRTHSLTHSLSILCPEEMFLISIFCDRWRQASYLEACLVTEESEPLSLYQTPMLRTSIFHHRSTHTHTHTLARSLSLRQACDVAQASNI